MADAEEITQLRKLLVLSCRRLHDLLVRGTLTGWLDVPTQIISDLAVTRAQIEHTQARLRGYGVVAADWTGELGILTPFGLLVSEPVLKEAEGLWTSNRFDDAVSVLRSAYATRKHDRTFTQRYLHYWYLLGVRAVILGQLTVARHAIQEVVQLDPDYQHAAELLHILERQIRGEPLPSPSVIELPAPSSRRASPHARLPQKGGQRLFSALPQYGRVLVGGIAALIAVMLLTDLGRWTRAQIGAGAVRSVSVATVAPVVAAVPLPATSVREPEATGSRGTPLPTTRPSAAPTVPLLPTAGPAAPPTALLTPTPAECGTRRVHVKAVNLRDAPLGTILRALHQGTQLTLMCETQTVEAREWVKVQVTADPRIVGWIRADYLE
jgi:hypothetical protein